MGASRAAHVFVVIPAVTIVLSARLDNEPLTVSLLLGAPLILIGVYLGVLRPSLESAKGKGLDRADASQADPDP
ncbi:hypothetical protein GCM10029992_59370 [Glycomyces albus]